MAPCCACFQCLERLRLLLLASIIKAGQFEQMRVADNCWWTAVHATEVDPSCPSERIHKRQAEAAIIVSWQTPFLRSIDAKFDVDEILGINVMITTI